MLVLSRKAGEKILIGDNISVTIVRIGPGVVRVGVEAPDDLPILREELTIALKKAAIEGDLRDSGHGDSVLAANPLEAHSHVPNPPLVQPDDTENRAPLPK